MTEGMRLLEAVWNVRSWSECYGTAFDARRNDAVPHLDATRRVPEFGVSIFNFNARCQPPCEKGYNMRLWGTFCSKLLHLPFQTPIH